MALTRSTHAATKGRALTLGGVPALLALAACVQNPAASSVATGSEFLLRAGETASVAETSLAVRFDLVAADSRCPADAVCVTLGDAAAVFSANEGGRPTASLTLHTAPGEGRSAVVGDWRLTLTRLDPYPSSSRPIQASDYQAWLRVDRVSGL
jgi:hypothetical protein